MSETQNTITFKRILPYTILAAIFILSSWIIGYFVGIHSPEISVHYTNQYKVESDLVASTHSDILMVILVFIINAIVGYCFMTLGDGRTILRYSILPVGMYAGYKLGAILALFVMRSSVRTILLLMLPHGIFELSALFMCVGTGLVIAQDVTKRQKYKIHTRNTELIKSAKYFYITRIIPIFLLAAIIETFVTLRIYEMFK
jgi:stage II sporulation protein M